MSQPKEILRGRIIRAAAVVSWKLGAWCVGMQTKLARNAVKNCFWQLGKRRIRSVGLGPRKDLFFVLNARSAVQAQCDLFSD